MPKKSNILFFSPYFHPYRSGITEYTKTLLHHISQSHIVSVLTFNHEHNSTSAKKVGNYTVTSMPYALRVSKGFLSPQSVYYFVVHLFRTDTVIVTLPNAEGTILCFLAKIMRKRLIGIYMCSVTLPTNLFNRVINSILDLSVVIQLVLSDTVVTIPDYAENTSLPSFITRKYAPIMPPVKELTASKATERVFKAMKTGVWIGFVGRIAEEKGIEILIEALQVVKTDYTLVFAGPDPKHVVGESAYFEKTTALLQKLKTPHIMLGEIANNDLGALYKVLDVLVVPSINSTEAFGLVQAEAMLCGTPVIASNLPGVRLPIQLTGMGRLFRVGDVQDCSNALLDVLENRKKYTKPSFIKTARDKFDVHKTVEMYEKLLP